MSFALNNVTTQDTYTEANTLQCGGAVRVNIDVANAAIYYQLSALQGVYSSGEAWMPEVFVAPGWRSLERKTQGVRVRSATPGLPAQVTVDAVTEYEITAGRAVA